MTEDLLDNLDENLDNRIDEEGKNRFVIYNFDFQKYDDFGKGTQTKKGTESLEQVEDNLSVGDQEDKFYSTRQQTEKSFLIEEITSQIIKKKKKEPQFSKKNDQNILSNYEKALQQQLYDDMNQELILLKEKQKKDKQKQLFDNQRSQLARLTSMQRHLQKQSQNEQNISDESTLQTRNNLQTFQSINESIDTIRLNMERSRHNSLRINLPQIVSSSIAIETRGAFLESESELQIDSDNKFIKKKEIFETTESRRNQFNRSTILEKVEPLNLDNMPLMMGFKNRFKDLRDQSRLKIEKNINDSIRRAEKYDKFKDYKSLLNLKNFHPEEKPVQLTTERTDIFKYNSKSSSKGLKAYIEKLQWESENLQQINFRNKLEEIKQSQQQTYHEKVSNSEIEGILRCQKELIIKNEQKEIASKYQSSIWDKPESSFAYDINQQQTAQKPQQVAKGTIEQNLFNKTNYQHKEIISQSYIEIRQSLQKYENQSKNNSISSTDKSQNSRSSHGMNLSASRKKEQKRRNTSADGHKVDARLSRLQKLKYISQPTNFEHDQISIQKQSMSLSSLDLNDLKGSESLAIKKKKYKKYLEKLNKIPTYIRRITTLKSVKEKKEKYHKEIVLNKELIKQEIYFLNKQISEENKQKSFKHTKQWTKQYSYKKKYLKAKYSSMKKPLLQLVNILEDHSVCEVIEQKQEIVPLVVTEEIKINYLRKKQKEIEMIRDRRYKRMLRDGTYQILNLSQWKQKYNLTSHPELQDGLFVKAIMDAYCKQWNGQKESKFEIDKQHEDKDIEKWTKIFTQEKQNLSTFQDMKDQLIANTGLDFSQHSARTEPFEINGKPIPMDFLKACLTFDQQVKDDYVKKRQISNMKQLIRLNTQFAIGEQDFQQVDLFRDMPQSNSYEFSTLLKEEIDERKAKEELEDQEVEENQQQDDTWEIVSQLSDKTQFLQAVKSNQKLETGVNQHRIRTFVQNTIAAGNIPFNIQQFVQRQILFLPIQLTKGVIDAIGIFEDEIQKYTAYLKKIDHSPNNSPNLQLVKKLRKEQVQKLEMLNFDLLVLQNNNIDDYLFSILLKNFIRRQNFVKLKSTGNNIGYLTTCVLEELLNDENHKIAKLQEITLSQTVFEPEVDFEILGQIFQNSNYLKILNLRQINLSSLQATEILKAVATSTSITHFDISFSTIGIRPITQFFTKLENNKTLQSLNISGITLSKPNLEQKKKPEAYISKFCLFLKFNFYLTHLNISHCNINKIDLNEILQNIKRSMSLHIVHLCGNKEIFENESINLIKKVLKLDVNKILFSDQAIIKRKLALLGTNLHKYIKVKQQHINRAYQIKCLQRDINCQTDPFISNLFSFTSQDNKQVVEENEANRQAEAAKVAEAYQQILANTKGWIPKLPPGELDKPSKDKKGKSSPQVAEKQEIKEDQAQQNKLQEIPFIISKTLRHPEILNSRSWRLNQYKQNPSQLTEKIDCRMCSRYQYTIIFWSQISGQNHNLNDEINSLKIQKLIQKSNLSLSNLIGQNQIQLDDNKACPLICGSFTNWEARRMLTIEECLALIANEKKVLNDSEAREQYRLEITSNLESLIYEYSSYPDVQFIDFEHYKKIVGTDKKLSEMAKTLKLYAYVDFIAPGAHQYFVSYEKTCQQIKYHKKGQSSVEWQSTISMVSYHEFLGKIYRSGEYKTGRKGKEDSKVVRQFNKDKSVFKDWKHDNHKKLKVGFLEEIKYWKVGKFVKDPLEVEAIIEFMIKYLETLKTIFIVKSSQSYYPLIRSLNYNNFIYELGIFDSNFDQSAVERIFLATTKNVDPELYGVIPEKDMSRMQFYESIVRVGYQKYKNSGQASTSFQAVKTFILDDLIPKTDISQWQDWRQDRLWSLPVEDLFKTNLEAMKSLYYGKNKQLRLQKGFTYEDAQNMFGITENNPVYLNPEQVLWAWGMSKFTVENELRDRTFYKTMVFVEFLELFGRIAELKMKDIVNTQKIKEGEFLAKKINMLMDMMLPLYTNSKRQQVIEDNIYVSEDEEEADDNLLFLQNQY